jgi:chemotaxis protein CheY-P-specific phosphatase CheC
LCFSFPRFVYEEVVAATIIVSGIASALKKMVYSEIPESCERSKNQLPPIFVFSHVGYVSRFLDYSINVERSVRQRTMEVVTLYTKCSRNPLRADKVLVTFTAVNSRLY